MKTSILGIDPGKTDFAYAHAVNGKLITVGTITETIDDLKQITYQYRVKRFYKTFCRVVKECSKLEPITHITCERFQHRPGRGAGAVSESINIMIGVITLYCYKHNVHIALITASTWKNKYRRLYGDDTQASRFGYAQVTKTKKTWPISDHEFDASGICLYMCEKLHDIHNQTFMVAFTQKLKLIWNARNVNST